MSLTPKFRSEPLTRWWFILSVYWLYSQGAWDNTNRTVFWLSELSAVDPKKSLLEPPQRFEICGSLEVSKSRVFSPMSQPFWHKTDLQAQVKALPAFEGPGANNCHKFFTVDYDDLNWQLSFLCQRFFGLLMLLLIKLQYTMKKCWQPNT